MTAQIPDFCIYEGETYEIVYIDGQSLIIPQDYDIEPEMLHTGCYRGFYSTYKIEQGKLLLEEMVVSNHTINELDNYPPINGVIPEQNEDGYWYYKKVNLSTPFTGNIRLAKDFIDELYIHMGYQKGTAFQILLELKFDNGNLIDFKDISDLNAQKRGAFKNYAKTRPREVVDKSFDLNFDDLSDI